MEQLRASTLPFDWQRIGFRRRAQDFSTLHNWQRDIMTANSEFLLVVDTVTKEMMVEAEIKCGSIQKNP